MLGDTFHTYPHYYQYQGNISSIFSSNSEANASEFIENCGEMFPQYYTHSDVLIK